MQYDGYLSIHIYFWTMLLNGFLCLLSPCTYAKQTLWCCLCKFNKLATVFRVWKKLVSFENEDIIDHFGSTNNYCFIMPLFTPYAQNPISLLFVACLFPFVVHFIFSPSLSSISSIRTEEFFLLFHFPLLIRSLCHCTLYTGYKIIHSNHF